MKNLNLKLALVMAAFGVISCSNDAPNIENLEEENSLVIVQRTPLTPTEINAKINETISSREDFEWSNMDAHMIWSATVHGDQILTIGYGADDNDFNKENSNASGIKAKAVVNAVIKIGFNLSKEPFTMLSYKLNPSFLNTS